MGEETSDISLDSMASTTASDVLIRSTSVHMTCRPSTANGRLMGDPSRLHSGEAAGGGGGGHGHHYPGTSMAGGDERRVHISVQRLREVPPPVLPDFAFRKRDPGCAPPALPANKYPEVILMEGKCLYTGCHPASLDTVSERLLIASFLRTLRSSISPPGNV